MTVLPVIDRELRAQARRGFTYLLRVLAAAALLCACVWFGFEHGFAPKMGAELFGYLNCALVSAIWILAPIICADCISGERREGTVGLLFLTPLKARDIVLAKGFVHGLRSMTLLLAVLPVMTITFLLGGVTWREAILAALVNFSCICWALAAGLLASSFSKSWLRSMMLSGGLAGCFFVLLIVLTGWRVICAVRWDPMFRLPFPYYGWHWQLSLTHNFAQVALPIGFFSISDAGGWWGTMFGSLPLKSQSAWLMQEGIVVLISMLALLGIVMLAAWNLRRTWQEEPRSARMEWLEEKLCSPMIGVGFYHRWLRGKLEKNPMGWLEQRTWSGRLVTSGWFAVMISFYTMVTTAPNALKMLGAVQEMLSWTLMGIIAASAAGSFQRERETRVLELLLVSPLSVKQILWGRLRGIWGQFAPAAALLLGVWIYLCGVVWQMRDWGVVTVFCGAYVSLPVIGLYYSLSRKQFIVAFLWTVWTGVFLPMFLKWLLVPAAGLILSIATGLGFSLSDSSLALRSYIVAEWLAEWPLLIILVQVALAAWFGRSLHRNLVQRNFTL